jgi:transcriptional regulator with XRE-family HTH domain
MAGTNFSEAFASVLKKHRITRGLSKNALAEKAGVHQTHPGLVERAARNVTLNTANALAEALGVPLSKMIAEAESLRAKQMEKPGMKPGSKNVPRI